MVSSDTAFKDHHDRYDHILARQKYSSPVFSLFFSVEIAECTEERVSAHLFSRGHFTSPTYPSKYPPSRVCSWTLQAPPGHFMRVTFDAFQTQCPNDNVIVRDNDQNGQLIGQFCGGQKPPMHHGRKLWVRFTSDDDIILSAERGFNATYEASPCKCYFSRTITRKILWLSLNPSFLCLGWPILLAYVPSFFPLISRAGHKSTGKHEDP